ncbi:MAG: HAMP domain-containing histidine kinase [Ruminococcus sp.]|nr:HAMP domain-containing histidine kinase [Ruminococcus sp.]
MKRLSARVKITLWFSIALVLIVLLTYVLIFSVNRQVVQKTIRDSLIETVENNVDEIEFYNYVSAADIDDDMDFFIQYDDGYLEIDDDFLDEVNQVYTALYTSNGEFVYGENIIASETVELEFSDSSVQKITVDGELYYVYDKQLEAKGLDNLWLRGTVSETQGEHDFTTTARISLIILPLLVLAAIVGGFFIAKRVLSPIKQISDAAAKIRQGDDLKQRIEIGEGKDEIHQLADQFNGMFSRLEESFKSQQQFVSDASHELRTPVAVILAQCELSEQKNGGKNDDIKTIERQGKKMNRLINDMLSITRMELNPQRYVFEKLNLSELCETLCFDMSLIKDKNITLEAEIEDNIFINANSELISRLISNLINNAYRYGKQGGHIWVKLESKEGAAILSVKDDGIGVSRGEQQNIFRRFYQVDSSRSNGGTGLGLAMASEIAQFHGGKISVDSVLGQGSTFIFTIEKSKD